MSEAALGYSDSAPGEALPSVILIHALGASAAMWASLTAALSGRCREIAVDLPGHGGAPPIPEARSLDALGALVLGSAHRAGVGQFAVCGISLGGMVGLWLAANAPHRVSALVASNTAARIGSEELWHERIEAVQRVGMSGVRDAVVARFFAPDFPTAAPEVWADTSRAFDAIDPDGYVACCEALREADISGALADIACPTLIIGGMLDVATPPSESARLHQLVAGSALLLLPGSAHLSSLDQPELFNSAVIDHLCGPNQLR